MSYHYDPILCMNVPDSTSKAKDAKTLDDSKADFQKVISLTKQIDDITKRYARKIDANAMFAYTDQIRRKVQYYIDNADRGWYDAAPTGMRDADIKLVQTIASKNGYAVHVVESDYGKRVALTFKGESYKNPHMWLGEATEGNKRKAIEMMNEFAEKAGSKNHDAFDKAIRTADRVTVWESDEYDDIYVSYEGGTYVLYVENRPQADGSQQKMIQLAKQEERIRG